MIELALGLAGIGVLVFLAIRYGAVKESRKDSEQEAESAKAMLDAEVNAPKDKDALLDKLRRSGF